jgi:hypothetical protein
MDDYNGSPTAPSGVVKIARALASARLAAFKEAKAIARQYIKEAEEYYVADCAFAARHIADAIAARAKQEPNDYADYLRMEAMRNAASFPSSRRLSAASSSSTGTTMAGPA